MKLIFMGTPVFSVATLNSLVEAGHEIACVYSQPPRRSGRGKSERKTPVHQRAEALGLPVRTPPNFKDEEEIEALEALNAEIAVVVAYGLLLPQTVLDAPSRGCLNIHASLLPRWRGAAPIQRAIMAGDESTGVCIMQMEAGLDTGPVLLRRETSIKSTDTASTLHDRLATMGSEAIVEVLASLDAFNPKAQLAEGVTYAQKIDKAEARVNWNKSAELVDYHIRGLSPFPGAWSELDGVRVKFLLSQVTKGEGVPGTTLDDVLTIAAGEGAVRILRAQRAGKAASSTEELLRGFSIAEGRRFE